MSKTHVSLPMTKRPRGSSKWFDAVIVETSSLRIANKRAGTEHQPTKPLRRGSVSPSAMQVKIINACLAEVDELMRVFSLPPARISADRIHFLSPGEFTRLLGPNKYKAVEIFGHVYLKANVVRRARDLAVVLTHELAHVASFTVLVYTRGKPPIVPLVGLQACAAHLGRLGHDNFGALNEVVTEMAAHNMRNGLVERGVIGPKDADYVANYWFNQTYAPLSRTVIAALRLKQNEMESFQRRCLHSMLTGSKRVFSVLRQRGMLDELLNLPNDPHETGAFMLRHLSVL